MKTLIATLFTIVSIHAFAGEGQFEKAMTSNINKIWTSQSSDLDQLTHTFTRIAEAEKDKWTPYYYASLCQVFKSFQTADLKTKDAVLDAALEKLTLAENLSQDNSEIVALQGFVYMLKIEVDPGTRGQSLSPKIYQLYGKALKLNPENPRAVLFMGQMQMGSAQFFGQSTDEACQMIMSSIDLFEKQSDEDPVAPSWGMYGIERWTSQCSPTE
ncbi:hypothetical protein [Reichenbachiella ulvae]|uniref:Tetratricopeptide repeat-containing protein n=1 Tax=Reichenbachiella ulvae TaxID=2980104 RepID=A0ABT3CQN1_9BACT|nr:hypothetical protein [Reichenbachiella ulvae]MCV9385573.1 hypothetical protein [Reichenbachiella ulvae]